ncbi:MAG: AAA family ATPase [Bacteroidota bacterium]
MQIDSAISVQKRTASLLAELSKGLYEREKAIKLALLSTIAGESIFLLGPPGVGKSLIARRLKYAFKDGTSFEYLMSKFSTPDEIFGPVSIKKLKEEDKYERLTDRYLPGANIVFLDEIWKAGPAIQNALLTILNEKVYRNGDKDIPVKIRGIITASNELPPSNHSLDPIWDRFLIRLEIGNIKQFKNFLTMITDTQNVYEDNIADGIKLNEAELNQWNKTIDEIEVPAEVLNTIQLVKVKMEEFNARPNNADKQIKIYDRRWKKIIRLFRTSAFLNGRQKVNLMDCFLMVECLWNKPIQYDIIKEIVSESIRKHGYSMAVNLNMLKREINEFEADVNQEIKVNYTLTEENLMPVKEDYYQLLKDESKFEGSLIPIIQFQNLSNTEEEVTNFYDQDGKLVNRLRAKKSTKEHTIEVIFNSVTYNYPLKTHKIERKEVVYKKPHQIVEKYWEERYERLMTYIQQQEAHIDSDAPLELNAIEYNLFVEPNLSEIVKANMQEVQDSLRQLKLKLEKIQYAYASLTHK